MYTGEKYRWKEGTTSGMDQRIESLEARIDSIHNAIAEVQNYIAEQTPFNDEVDEPVSCEWCNYFVCQCDDKKDNPGTFQDRNDLIDVITVAFKGLKPDATINQQNIAYYAVRSVLNQEE